MKRILILLLMLSVSVGYGQYKGGTTAAQFLKIGQGSRAVGMGEAYVAMSDDASGLYWNPGGISRASGAQLMFGYTNWIADMDLNFFGIIAPLYGVGTVGVAITSLTMNDMLVRTEEEPDGTGERFSPSMLAMQLSFGRNLTDRFSIGFNAKYIQEQIWHMQASTMAIDVGTLFRTQFKDMRLGMSISNYGGDMQMSGRDALVRHDPEENAEGNNDQIPANQAVEAWDLPLLFRVGVALDVLEMGVSKLTIAADALHPNDNYESINLGAEFNVMDRFFLRGGYKSPFVETNSAVASSNIETREEGFTFGGGINLPLAGSGTALKIDYSYADFGRLTNAQRFTLNLTF
jgi:hypothetical protein